MIISNVMSIPFRNTKKLDLTPSSHEIISISNQHHILIVFDKVLGSRRQRVNIYSRLCMIIVIKSKKFSVLPPTLYNIALPAPEALGRHNGMKGAPQLAR